MQPVWVALDAGGTFLDVVVLNAEHRTLRVLKLARRLEDQSDEIRQAINQLKSDLPENQGYEQIVVGTTVITNGLIEGRLTSAGLVTTEGFRDVLALGRMLRASSYDLRARRPPVLVSDDHVFEVAERIGYDGKPIADLDESSLWAVITGLAEAGVKSVAVCLLHSFVNEEHERAVGRAIEEELGIPVTLSVDLWPVSGEYERMSTTVVNAAAIPVFTEFASGLESISDAPGNAMLVMSSAGTCLPLAEARRRPAATILSGPAGGVAGGLRLARRYGQLNAITLDVGGTSSDVALLRDGVPLYAGERSVGGYSVGLPSLDIQTIGAGGGSLARVDRMGLLSVGPESAGSDPGPVAYGRGGTIPTVTDCLLALGFLGERSMLGGHFLLDRNLAVEAIERHLAAPLGTTWAYAAQGVVTIATGNMVRAVRRVSVERGYDPREAVLIAFGGAGPLHGVEVARSLGMRRVLVPSVPGVFAALGMLLGEVSYGHQWNWARDLLDVTAAQIVAEFGRVEADLANQAEEQGLVAREARRERSAELRYRGQGHTLALPLEIAGTPVEQLTEAFHDKHMVEFHYRDLGAVIEIVNLRSNLVWASPVADDLVSIRPLEEKRDDVLRSEEALKRTVWSSDGERVAYRVYDRSQLEPGTRLVGPALVEQYDSVTVIGPGDVATVDEGVLDIEVAKSV